LTARYFHENRMDIDVHGLDYVHLLGGSARHGPAPRLVSAHAALLVLAGISTPRPRVLLGTPVTALANAFNHGF